MNLKEKCEELGISLKDGKAKFGLTHWKQEVIEEIVDDILDGSSEEVSEKIIEVLEDAVEEAAQVVKQAIDDSVPMEDKIKSVRGLGTKSKYWSELNG
jgi:hypothetical protein